MHFFVFFAVSSWRLHLSHLAQNTECFPFYHAMPTLFDWLLVKLAAVTIPEPYHEATHSTLLPELASQHSKLSDAWTCALSN